MISGVTQREPSGEGDRRGVLLTNPRHVDPIILEVGVTGDREKGKGGMERETERERKTNSQRAIESDRQIDLMFN